MEYCTIVGNLRKRTIRIKIQNRNHCAICENIIEKLEMDLLKLKNRAVKKNFKKIKILCIGKSVCDLKSKSAEIKLVIKMCIS